MGYLTFLFVFGLLLAALFITLSVRRDFVIRERVERERRYQTQHSRQFRKR